MGTATTSTGCWSIPTGTSAIGTRATDGDSGFGVALHTPWPSARQLPGWAVAIAMSKTPPRHKTAATAVTRRTASWSAFSFRLGVARIASRKNTLAMSRTQGIGSWGINREGVLLIGQPRRIGIEGTGA